MCLAEAVGGLRRYLKNEKPSLQLTWRDVKENMAEQHALRCECNPGREEVAARAMRYLADMRDVTRLFPRGCVEPSDDDEYGEDSDGDFDDDDF